MSNMFQTLHPTLSSLLEIKQNRQMVGKKEHLGEVMTLAKFKND